MLYREGICEARRSVPVVSTIASTVAAQPFHVCAEVADALQTYSLRPIEWFNLAAIHGPLEFFLHDDFYDQDGVALQPTVPVLEPEKHPAPSIDQAERTLVGAVDYAMTRWWLRAPVVAILREHSSQSLLEEIRQRVELFPNRQIEGRAYEIAGRALGTLAAEWLRLRWDGAKTTHLYTLSFAGVDCLGATETFDRVVQALSELPQAKLAQSCLCLASVRSNKTLDWIEQNIADPLTTHWGDLAALSHIDWGRIRQWLRQGRPLSLVALDALGACAGPLPSQSYLVQGRTPRLQDGPSLAKATDVLLSYQRRDPSPRVRAAVKFITSKWETICATAR